MNYKNNSIFIRKMKIYKKLYIIYKKYMCYIFTVKKEDIEMMNLLVDK